MALDLISIRSSIKNLLDKNNTNTSSYYISNNLSTTVQQVVAGYHLSKPVPDYLYPAIWVELKNKTEEFANLSNSARRDATINFDIVAVVQHGLGQIDGREASDIEMITLASNIETLLRNKVQLSQTSVVVQSLANGTEYDVVESNDTYNSIAIIGLEVMTFSN